MKLENYSSIDEKRKTFPSHKTILTVTEFEKWYKKEVSSVHKYVYRGVPDAQYKNYTSAQRLYITHDFCTASIDLKDLIQYQIDALRREQGFIFNNYYKSMGITPNDLLYLSLAQHYGGISPLLDFTKELKTALCFMTSDAEILPNGGTDIQNFVSIYRFEVDDSRKFSHVLKDASKNVEQHINDLQNNYNYKTYEINVVQEYARFNDLIRFTHPFLLPNEPLKLKLKLRKGSMISGFFSISNLNIVAQKGCFVFYYNNSKPIEPFETDIECIDIHKSLIPYIKDKIVKNQYSRLFPQEKEIVKASLQHSLSLIR